MKEVKVQKMELLTKLQNNRETHVKEFEENRLAWRFRLYERLEESLAFVINHTDEQLLDEDHVEALEDVYYIRDLPKPESHESDYHAAIQMLLMKVEQTVVLSQHEFRQYVLDDWDCKGQHVTTSNVYRASSSR